jgi:hypothetical protein
MENQGRVTNWHIVGIQVGLLIARTWSPSTMASDPRLVFQTQVGRTSNRQIRKKSTRHLLLLQVDPSERT